MGVTVAICCYNSAKRIQPTLEHLLAQTGTVPGTWEVLLIDNGCKDETVAVAKKTWTSAEIPFRVISEPQPGLMNARKCAFREAAFEYISFLDDDNWAYPQWVSEVERILDANPSVAAVGARTEPVFETPAPPWFARFQGCYAAGQQWPETGDITDKRGFVWGAGITIRKSAWEQIVAAGFQTHTEGRRGAALTGGEDNEICQALRLAGWRLYHEPRLNLKHYIPSQRLQWDYLRKIVTNFGVSSILLDGYLRQYSAPASAWHLRFVDHWMHPAISALKALLSHPITTIRVLSGGGVGHPSAYNVFFHYGRLLGAIRMRGTYNSALQSISNCAQGIRNSRYRAQPDRVAVGAPVPAMPPAASTHR